MFSPKSLLPTKTEVRKLFLEIWKYAVLAAVIGIVTLLSPPVRSGFIWLWKACSAVAFAKVPIRGWVLLLLALTALLIVLQFLRWLPRRLFSAYIRAFTQAHYVGIDWTWRWKKGRVDRSSMTPLCPKCETEFILEPTPGDNGRPATSIFCTFCNAGFAINVADLREHVARKIEGDVRSDRWKTQLPKSPGQPNHSLEKAAELPVPAMALPAKDSRSAEEEKVLLQLTNGQRRPAHNIAYRIGISSDHADIILEALYEADLVNRKEFYRLEFEDPQPPEWFLTTAGKRYLAERRLI